MIKMNVITAKVHKYDEKYAFLEFSESSVKRYGLKAGDELDLFGIKKTRKDK